LDNAGRMPVAHRKEKEMERKLFSRSIMFSIVAIVSVTFILVGCGIFGGKGKEEEAAKTVVPVVVQPIPSKPLAAAETSEESKFESGELDYEVETVNGVVNWSKGFVRAKGHGIPPETAVNDAQSKLMAFKAAEADALAKLLEIINGVQVTATTTVKDYVLKDYNIELKVAGIIKGSKEVKRIFDEEKKVAIVEVGVAMEDMAMSIPKEELSFEQSASLDVWETKEDATLRQLAGGDEALLKSIKNSKSLDEIEQKLGKMADDNEKMADRDEQLLASIELLTQEIGKLKITEKPMNYTGLVINAAGSGIKPCMSPNIYYKVGNEYKLLYGAEDGRARDANLHALVVWERTLIGASDNTRVTQTPLIVSATHLAKEQSALAISRDDAMKIEQINAEKSLLEDGKVVIVR